MSRSKIGFFSLLLTTAFSQVFGAENVNDTKIKPSLELKYGYFFFADSKMREVYDRGGLDLQVTTSQPVLSWLQIYGSVEYFQKDGKSLNDSQRTSIWEIPVSVGVKPTFSLCKEVQYYFTVGPRYFYVHQSNHSSFVDKTVHKSGIGGFVNTGFNFIFGDHFLIDAFGEYSYCKMSFHPSKSNVTGRSIQVGGFAFGLGLGYAF